MDVKGRYVNLDSTRFSIGIDAKVIDKYLPEHLHPTLSISDSHCQHLFTNVIRWTKGYERPPSGSLVKLVTEDSQTRLELL